MTQQTAEGEWLKSGPRGAKVSALWYFVARNGAAIEKLVAAPGAFATAGGLQSDAFTCDIPMAAEVRNGAGERGQGRVGLRCSAPL